MKKAFLVLLGVIIICLLIVWAGSCNRTPPVVEPTPTFTSIPTKVLPTVTATSTEVVVEPTKEPTKTPEPTLEPTKEPTPYLLYVETGYENGALHVRDCPSKVCLPDWYGSVGAIYEGDELIFLGCPNTQYPWVNALVEGFNKFVYGEYLNENPCVR